MQPPTKSHGEAFMLNPAIGRFQKIGGKNPKWMVKIMENPMNKWMSWEFSHYFWVDTQFNKLNPISSQSTISHSCLMLLPDGGSFPWCSTNLDTAPKGLVSFRFFNEGTKMNDVFPTLYFSIYNKMKPRSYLQMNAVPLLHFQFWAQMLLIARTNIVIAHAVLRLCKGTSKKAAWAVPEMKPSCNLVAVHDQWCCAVHQNGGTWVGHEDSVDQ